MIYGQLQYYTDELNGWTRIIDFHKEELRASVSQIGALLNQQAISSADEKTSGAFTDQLMVQEQQFDHILNQVIGQQQRIQRSGCDPAKSIDSAVLQLQDALRIKVKTSEQHFIRIRYACSVYLSALLGEKLFAVRKLI